MYKFILSIIVFFILLNYIKGQNLIKNGTFKNRLTHWDYFTQNNSSINSPIITASQNNTMLSLKLNSRLSQSICTVAGEIYNINIKIFDIKGDAVFVNLYIDDFLVHKVRIEQNINVFPLYISTDFLAEHSKSILKIELQAIENQKEDNSIILSDIICNNKNHVVWKDYYKE